LKTIHKLLLRGIDSLTGINHDLKGSLHLANFCDYYLRQIENESTESGTQASGVLSDISMIKSEFPSMIVKQLLNAIQFGSYEARRRFPRLIQIVEEYENSETLETFIKEVRIKQILFKL
jgi:DNA-dependent protein kinase catalytic subunit